ncbi:Pkinase-domain-containing protein [Hyphopichia burtonii NRRL Y-1933]|uniref:Pkinase-domain-containing protein n=1 Tax=Hyphopichia burtonii NRRL Y-1933 TaxID=984485 RepID=A0A1E4RF94_9ASCO|nr:Pkinase-domain-containing protein [Hyphopichia burtonii NRRL Y-1933]ODV65913.1 Pkinase-domain-containing protein [Hyphopichia burtonii NRRL Y-1933]
MTDIFSMDDVSSQLDKVNEESLNYKLIDEEIKPSQSKEEDLNDTLTDLPTPIPMNRRRRASSTSKYSSSFEIDINESFVSPLNRNSPYIESSIKYKPKLSDFIPLKVLGKGAYGKVLLVKEKSTGRLFAQKQLKKASLIINETNQVNETNLKRTLNEKSILEKVNHSNIVKLFYAFQDNNKVYLILEYLDGGELFHHLAQEKFMSEKNSAYYIAQIILALRYLHSELKVIYRDLKPENCMLNSEGNLVLTDFGLSKVSSTSDSKHSMIGTAQYMAPEILKGEPYDYSVDWWSLGCVIYDLLTGSPPFTGNNNKKIMDKIISAKKNLKFPFYLSNDAKDLLRKLLQPNPDKRLNIDDDFNKLKNHRFFRFVDWNHLQNLNDEAYKKQILETSDYVLPPILPLITDPELAENFDEEFTEMPFTPPNSNGFLNIDKDDDLKPDILHVRGFSFTNEDYLKTAFDKF